MANIFTSKFLEMFRNLKPDAVPKPPRPEPENQNPRVEISDVEDINEDNDDSEHNKEESIFNTDFKKNDKPSPKPKNKKPKSNKDPQPEKVGRQDSTSSNVQTQATGNVINILNSKGVRLGNDITIYKAGYTNNKTKQFPEENIKKCNLITLLMEATVKPDHEYIDYVAKNLGRDWHSFFRRLGYTKGRIETVEIDEAKNGVSEARYKLLLDWIRNEDGTLGFLATQLWEEGERQVVKELSLIYSKNKK